MSGSLNKVMVIGRLGGDPEVKTTPSGAKVANFTMATDESYTDKSGEKTKKTEWHRIVAWRKLAEIIERFVKKGSQIYIEGKLQTRCWDDQNDQKRYTTEIVASSMQMLGGKKDNDNGQQYSQGEPLPPVEDDLPF